MAHADPLMFFKVARHRCVLATGRPPRVWLVSIALWNRLRNELEETCGPIVRGFTELLGVPVRVLPFGGPALSWRDVHGDTHVVLDVHERLWAPPEVPETDV